MAVLNKFVSNRRVKTLLGSAQNLGGNSANPRQKEKISKIFSDTSGHPDSFFFRRKKERKWCHLQIRDNRNSDRERVRKTKND
jgi:hypothetical protein